MDLRPSGGGRTHVIWQGGGPSRGLQVPGIVPGGVHEANRAIFVRL